MWVHRTMEVYRTMNIMMISSLVVASTLYSTLHSTSLGDVDATMNIVIIKVHLRSVDPQKNRRNYLITHSIFNSPIPRRSSLQRRSFDIYISAVGPKTKRLAVLP